MQNTKDRIMATVLVYRNQPLPLSETFIYNQTFRLQRYKAYMLGAKWPRGKAIPLPGDRVRVINEGGMQGWWREFCWKVLEQVPDDILGWTKQFRPCLLHAHFGPDGVIAIPLAQALQVPLVVTFHGMDASITRKNANAFIHKKYVAKKAELSKAATMVIAVSQFIKDKLLRQGFPEEKIRVIHCGIDAKKIYPRKQDNDRTSKVILFVGRLVPKKGVIYLLQAFQAISVTYPNAKLILIGDGPERERLERWAFGNLNSGTYNFMGSKNHEEVVQWLSKADLLVAPSVTDESGDTEGLPNTILEGMAAGLPIVSTYHAGIPEAVIDGETGFLCHERNVDELAARIIEILSNSDLSRRMGEAGRRRVEQAFNLEKQNAKLEALYDEVIAEHARLYG